MAPTLYCAAHFSRAAHSTAGFRIIKIRVMIRCLQPVEHPWFPVLLLVTLHCGAPPPAGGGAHAFGCLTLATEPWVYCSSQPVNWPFGGSNSAQFSSLAPLRCLLWCSPEAIGSLSPLYSCTSGPIRFRQLKAAELCALAAIPLLLCCWRWI